MAVVFRLEELERAWERVEDNGGCAGVDGVTVVSWFYCTVSTCSFK